MKNKIPDRWLDYSPMGSKVAGTRFIAFKAPLSKEICSKMKPAERFTPDILMERCPNMRLIIDLTNTDRYYNKQEFIDRGIQYEKIMCPGQVIPPQSLIFRFFEIIDDFYLKNGLKDVLIGIHCTHGVNRTGYFIGRYMVQRMGFHFEKAIPCIEEARGHKIERTNYIKDLKVQVPIPSSLSSSSGKKVIDSKPEQKKGSNNSSGKAGGKITKERSPDKPYRKPPPEFREPTGKASHRRSPEPSFRPKEPPQSFRPKEPPQSFRPKEPPQSFRPKEPPQSFRPKEPPQSFRPKEPPQSFRPKEPTLRSGNFGPVGGRPFSPGRRGNSPVRRGLSPGRRGISPGRRPPSPGRRGGRGPSPKRPRTPPRAFSPRRRSSPPRRSPRRMSPPRREGDFGPPPYRGAEDPREFAREPPSHRNYSPPRRNEPPSSNFHPRGPPDHQKTYSGAPASSSWQPPYENRGFNSSGGPTNSYRPASNQFSDSRPQERHWESRPNNNQPPFNTRPPQGGSGPSQWNNPPPNNFSAPPPNMNVPPPSFESRSGGPQQSGRFNERRFDDHQKFPPPTRDEPRRQWNEDNRPPNPGSSFNSSRFEESRGFIERGNEYRSRPEEKFDKPYRSPPRADYVREKRPPSPPREYPRSFDPIPNRPESGPWDNRRRSPEPPFVDYPRSGVKRRSRSPGRRVTPPPQARSRSPRRRSPPNRSGMFDIRRSPQRNRPIDGPPQPPRNRPSEIAPPFNPPHFDGPPPRSVPEPPYQDKRFFDSRDDCRDLLNQKRHFEGDRGEFYGDHKPKLDLRVVPKEVDLRKVIRGANPEPPLKDRLGPPPRDEPPLDVGRRYGRGRSRSPRGRSPPRYGGPPRRY